MNTLFLLLSSLLLPLAALFIWRKKDHRADSLAVSALESAQTPSPQVFSTQMLEGLPEPAQRFFLYTIEPGTPLYTVANLTMSGQFGMGDKMKPQYLQMKAQQTLALPEGFIWTMQARRGLLRLSGSDSQQWTRFWLMGLLPIARLGGDTDHHRSAFGRYVAEAVFWTPAALLPGPGITWSALDTHSARVTVTHQGLNQSVDVTVAPDGQPTQVAFQRWSNANPDKTHRLQPFGGYLSRFRSFQGFRLPTHVEAGNHFGTEQYFPFFIADVADITFPHD